MDRLISTADVELFEDLRDVLVVVGILKDQGVR